MGGHHSGGTGHAMRNEQGRATLTDRTTGNIIREVSTFQCHHCSRIIHVPVKADPAAIGGLCGHCVKLICPNCVGKPCTPWLERIYAFERKLDARRSYGF